MVAAAPTIDPRLVAILARIDDPARSLAETNRLLGRAAEKLGIPRPSYEQVRVIAHDLRARRRYAPSGTDLLLDVAFRSRPLEAVIWDLLG